MGFIVFLLLGPELLDFFIYYFLLPSTFLNSMSAYTCIIFVMFCGLSQILLLRPELSDFFIYSSFATLFLGSFSVKILFQSSR